MRISRQKKVHKILQFYSNNFGFRKPYQVLIDGTICNFALKNKIHIEDQLKKYLEGNVKLLTTQCNVLEVERLGSAFSGAAFIIKQYPIHQCGHKESSLSGSKCILEMINNNNPSRYIVATQDRELQAKCRVLQGVPLIYLHMKVPTLELPSEITRNAAKEKLSSHFQVSDYERHRLSLLDDSNQNVTEFRRKRKRKGGPNPLSCKKKKKKPNEEQNSEKKKKKTKIRKRNRNRLLKKVKKELMSST